MFEIKLHVYDLSQGMAAQFSRQLVGKHIEGIWHTGIVVYGKEYYFGGGISYDAPGQTPYGRPTKVMDLGFTEIPEDIFLEFLKEVHPRFSIETYHIFKHNCNNFTDECAQFLMGSGIPHEIVDLPNQFLNTPLGKMVEPMMQQAQESLKVRSHTLFDDGGHQNPLQTTGTIPQGSNFGGNQPNMNDMNNLINQFASGMGGVGPGAGSGTQSTASSNYSSSSSSKGAIAIQNLQQLQKLIKETPALAVDFWSPTCPPCIRIKPVFESLAQSNDNENLKFATVNTQTCRDCAMAFKITSIPQFYFYLRGDQFREFKGAREDQLMSTLIELGELVMTKSSTHKNLNYKQFRPMNLAPQGFTSMGNIDKMREFVQTFANSDDVKKEVKSTENLQKWLVGFKLENMPREAIDELMSMIEIAEDKFKIALIDLLRLLMMYEHTTAHILNRHWNTFEVTVFGYIQCMDIRDADARIMQNYHMICLKMLGNIYQTEAGKEFLQGDDASSALIDFCTYSFSSINPKVVFTAAIVLFNHILCYKREKSLLYSHLETAILKINEVFADPTLVDFEAVYGLLLCECRIVYQNNDICKMIVEKQEEIFKKNHQILELRVKNPKVKESIDDVFQMLFD